MSAALESLEPAWREAFELMWEAWRAGTIPVGAVLVDESGAVVRRARNRIFENGDPVAPADAVPDSDRDLFSSGLRPAPMSAEALTSAAQATPASSLSRTRLAHAEMNLLVGLTSARTYENWTLYTSLEPCLLCVGAAYAMRVGRLRFAGEDVYGGAAGRVRENDDMRAHPVAIEGPLEGPLGRLPELTHVAFFLLRRPEGNVIASYRVRRPELVERAARLLEVDRPGLTLAEATSLLDDV